MSQVEISVIIPVYNRADLIGKTIDSIRNQTFSNFECLLVDDASTDESEKVIAAATIADNRFKYYRNNRKKGAQGARNTGIDNAVGRFIQFFDSDDIMHPTLLQELYTKLNESDADISTCYSRVLDSENNVIDYFRFDNEGNIEQRLITGELYVDYNCALIKRQTINAFGLTDEDCPSFQEWDTHIRLSGIAKYTTVKNYLIDYYRRTQGTISGDPKRTVEGLSYILIKHRTKFVGNKKAILSHSATLLHFAQLSGDTEFYNLVKRRLYKLFPVLRRTHAIVKIKSFLKKVRNAAKL